MQGNLVCNMCFWTKLLVEGVPMKNFILKKAALTGLVCALSLPVTGLADSVESDVESYLEGKNPQSLSNYPAVFTGVYGQHAPMIKESTQITVLHYFNEADSHSYEDIAILTGLAVTAAIAEARSDGDEGDLEQYITDAVCGAFKGGLQAAYKQVGSEAKTVEGALNAALDAGVQPNSAAAAVVRGIDACLEERLEYAVAPVIGATVGQILGATGVSYSYIAPYQSYLPPEFGTGDPQYFADRPGFDTEVCVSNCI